jgi:hypothetical protein
MWEESKMLEIEYTHTDTRVCPRVRGVELGKALALLAAGVLLGLAAALPYDRLLGLPGSTGTILGSVVWVVLLGTRQLGGVAGPAAPDDLPARARAYLCPFNGFPPI